MKKLSRFTFAIGPGLWREMSQLYTSLDTALLNLGEYDNLNLIPAGHPHWRPFHGKTETTPLKPELYGWPWKVLRVFRYHDHPEWDPALNYLGAFSHPTDAFAFAELKSKLRYGHELETTSFHVCLWAHTEDGRTPEIARLPADHLTQLRRARDRDERKKDRQRIAA